MSPVSRWRLVRVRTAQMTSVVLAALVTRRWLPGGGTLPPQDGKHVTRQQANLKPHTKQPAVAGAVWWCVCKHALPTAQTP